MSETVRIGNYDVSKDDVWLYINHFDKTKKGDIFEWDEQRTILHNNIFKNLKIDRHSIEARDFSDALDLFCIPHIEKFDAFVAGLKRISVGQNPIEIEMAAIKLQQQQYLEKRYGFKQTEAGNQCRVCSRMLVEGVPRINDIYAGGAIKNIAVPKSPICQNCSNKKPDAFHIAFQKAFWSKAQWTFKE